MLFCMKGIRYTFIGICDKIIAYFLIYCLRDTLGGYA